MGAGLVLEVDLGGRRGGRLCRDVGQSDNPSQRQASAPSDQVIANMHPMADRGDPSAETKGRQVIPKRAKVPR
jgi:hypothetical protein